MKKISFGIFLFSFLFLICVNLPVWAEETKTQLEQKIPFTLEVSDNLINLQAEQANFKEILSDLET